MTGSKNTLPNVTRQPLDASVLESYATEMAEAVPQIVLDIEQRELLAAELRVLPPTTSHPKKEWD